MACDCACCEAECCVCRDEPDCQCGWLTKAKGGGRGGLPAPYHRGEGITLYHGDCRKLLPSLGTFDAVITDPVWPNCKRVFPDLDPWELWAETVPLLAERCTWLVVILGCDSDPRFLGSVPRDKPFARVIYLRHAQPHYKARLLYSGDMAYVFGPAKPATGHLLGGEVTARDSRKVGRTNHPCPRRWEHMLKLVNWLVPEDGTVLDPFAGSGTTLWAAKEAGRRAVGVELEEEWCRDAVGRLRQRVLFPPGGVR